MASAHASSTPYQPLLGAPAPSRLAAQSAAALPTADQLMDWAERAYPAYFPDRQTNQAAGNIVYRFYPKSGNYLGVSGSDVLVLGPISQNIVRNVGTLAQFADVVAASPAPAAITDEDAARFLLQAQFSASDADIAAVRSKGYAAYLSEQLRAPASQSGLDWLDARGYATIDNATRYYDNSYPGDYMIWSQLMTSSDAVRKRLALALSEFFVVSLSGLDFAWRSHGIAAWWDLLVGNATGNYRTLLERVTLNAAMGYYLNTKGNRKENLTTGGAPDENYAREVMQLFSIGLSQLNLDGTEKRDASGNKIDSYTQSDVSNMARMFTGWDVDNTQNVATLEPVQNRTIPNTAYTRLPMRLNEANHSTLQSTFLGTTVAAGTTGVPALKAALDTLFNHPNVGPFFGRQMIQRLVTSNPSPAYVARVASVFNNNGSGVRGDLGAVFSAVLLDEEARGPSGLTQNGFGKLREPMLRLVQWGRTFGITSARGSWKIGDLGNPATQLGQTPLRSPSVFNFFRPGYVPPSTALSASQTPAPEFQLVNESSVSGYLNYLQGVVRSGIFVNAPDMPNTTSNANNGFDITASYAAELALALDAAALVRRLNLLLCAGQLSSATQSLIVNALNATPVTAISTDNARRDRVAAAVLLVMASSEYLIQK
ncbi:MAG: DUF1800 domain-containing protein [Polaromonas sp.]|nr:MAG: DUF1800 domain-containing protein [Polaromonas sp.]